MNPKAFTSARYRSRCAHCGSIIHGGQRLKLTASGPAHAGCRRGGHRKWKVAQGRA